MRKRQTRSYLPSVEPLPGRVSPAPLPVGLIVNAVPATAGVDVAPSLPLSGLDPYDPGPLNNAPDTVTEPAAPVWPPGGEPDPGEYVPGPVTPQ